MRFRIFLFSILFTAWLAYPAHASEKAMTLSLSQALTLARERNVEVIVSQERVVQSMDRLTQARSAFLPQVNGSASLTRQTKNLKAFGIDIPGNDAVVGPFNTFDARVAVSQTLLDVAAIQRLRAVRNGRLVSQDELAKANEDAMALVATLYVEAQRAEERAGLGAALLKTEQKRLEIAQASEGIGAGSAMDLLSARSNIADARNQLAQSKTQALSARLDLAAALGIPEERPIRFTSSRKDLLLLKTPTEGEALASASTHPNVKIAAGNVRQREIERSVEKADFFPRVSVGADYGASGSSPGDVAGTYSFGGQLTVPIFRGGLRSGRIKEASSRLRESEARRDDIVRHTEAEVRAARDFLLQTQSVSEAAEAEREEAAKRLMIAKERRESGLGDALQLTEAESGAALARDRANEARAARRLAAVNLAHAMGTMDDLLETQP